MSNKEKQPREFDAVLGGEISPPVTGVVLGGIERVKRRLKSEDEKVRIAALEDAFNYGDEGLDLLIEALKDDSEKVKDYAVSFLQEIILNPFLLANNFQIENI
ncbi:MAG: hypothetical protein QNJ47_03680 [Nostocaceae cyanobacterium]|nr:hypothetical protein [Nostocaceae cyanobacterium]